MPSISRLEATAVSLPVKRPTRMSTRTLDRRDYLLVRVGCDAADAEGIGYAYVGTRGGAAHVAIVDELLAPVLHGEDADAIAAIWQRLYQETLLAGRRGAVLRCLSAIDIALWDLLGKRRGAPIAVLLGGGVAPVPAYASGGYYRPEDGSWTDAVAREIEANRAAGFRDHKIKVGGLAVSEDAARVTAAARAIDGAGRLALDANNAYGSIGEAVHAIRAFQRAAGDVELWWVEEPLSPDDIAGLARVAEGVTVSLASGEINQSRWEFRDLIERGAADVLQPDAGVVGGITEWVRVAHAAEAFGLRIAPHWHANLHAQLATAIPGCIAIEHFALEKDIYNFELLVTPDTRLVARDGAVHLSDRPGLGIELDEEAVRHFTIARSALSPSAGSPPDN